MLLRTIEQLEECESKCQEWHEEALKSLNEAQTAEYYRLVSFFEATKYWYKGVLDNSVVESKKLNKERGYFWGIGFLVFLVIWYFSGSDSLELKIIAPLFILLGIYYENNGKVLDREIAAEIRKIERDLSLTGVILSVTYKIIQKEREIEKASNSQHTMTEEYKDRLKLQSFITEYYWRDCILGKVTNYKLRERLPMCANLAAMDSLL